jgi:hypothetical protein
MGKRGRKSKEELALIERIREARAKVVEAEEKAKAKLESDYFQLQEVFKMAYDRASKTKGRVRHANSKPFEEQPACTELRLFGIEPAVYQIRKKAREAVNLPPTMAINELLDVMVYSAAAVIVLSEGTEVEFDGSAS